jgi:hypothetical protein
MSNHSNLSVAERGFRASRIGVNHENEERSMKAPVKEKLHYDPKRECVSGACLGGLFPDFLVLIPNVLHRGRGFGVLIESFGIGVQHKEIVRDEAAWKKVP